MPVVRENKTGTISTFYDDDSGRVREDGSGDDREFFQPGAKREFVVGDAVNYLRITLPTGGVVVAEIKKPL
jgi:hypothetical protein